MGDKVNKQVRYFQINIIGTLSPAAGRGTGSIGTSGGTWHFHPRGKCREFLRKRFTFPRGSQGYRLHRPLWPHSPFPPLGKVPGISAKTVHFPPRPAGAPASQVPLAALTVSTSGESAGNFRETVHFPLGRFTFPRGWRLLRRSSRTCFGKCLVYRHSEKEHLLDLG